MIQRPQTIFMILAIIISYFNHFIPYFSIEAVFLNFPMEFYIFKVSSQVEELDQSMNLQWTFIAILHIIFSIGVIYQISQFKDRKKQLKIGKGNILIASLHLAIVVAMMLNFTNSLHAELKGFWGLVFPVSSIVMIIISNRFIQKDEDLIKSIDRIR